MTTLQLKRMSCQPVERQRLATCLDVFGVRVSSAKVKCHSKRTTRIGKLTLWQLTDLYDSAKAAFRALCWKYRPDTGNHEIGVWLNALWAHTKKLFRRMGVETI